MKTLKLDKVIIFLAQFNKNRTMLTGENTAHEHVEMEAGKLTDSMQKVLDTTSRS